MRHRGVDQRPPHALGDAAAFAQVRIRQKHEEFFAAEAGDDVFRLARLGGEDVCHLLQTGIAGKVSIMIVVTLEMVDIDHDRCDLRERPLPQVLQGFVEAAAVQESGQLVVPR